MDVVKEKLIPIYVTLIKNNRKSIDEITDEELKRQIILKLEEGNQDV